MQKPDSWDRTLKDEREVTIRFLTSNDKQKLLDMFTSLSKEALQWALPPYTEEVITRWLSNLNNLIPLVAEYQTRIIGYAAVFKHPHQRRKGTSSLLMYLHQDFHNIGLGTYLLEILIELACKAKLRRITLHVIADNNIAVHLYQKAGFQVEGKMKDSYVSAVGSFHDEMIMGKLLNCSQDLKE